MVQYVTCGDQRLVLRVYNNGSNTARVRFEHALLAELRKVSDTLSFAVPRTLPALAGGGSHVPLSNGAEASMFELIPGTLPKLTHTRAIGKAFGELTTAMYGISVAPLESPTAPYWQIYKVHHAVTRESFFATVAGPAFDSVRGATDFLVEQLRSVESTIEECHALQLPSSLIHGDGHYDNVLVQDGAVSGLLDFEFAAQDWRAMELAICLSKYVGEPNPMSFLEPFIEGFAEKGVLTAAEIKAMPALINLRVLSNVVYFVGRALSGEDDITSLTSRAEAYAARVRWVNANGQLISDGLTKAMAGR